jgi:hypothetical protein
MLSLRIDADARPERSGNRRTVIGQNCGFEPDIGTREIFAIHFPARAHAKICEYKGSSLPPVTS